MERKVSKKVPDIVVMGRLNHDQIFIEKKDDGDYWINDDFGGPAAYASIAAAAQGEKVGLVSHVAEEFLYEDIYKDVSNNYLIDIAGVTFHYDKMPMLRVWYPNNERKLTIGMVWDDNPEIRYDMIPPIFLRAKHFLFMPMIDEIPVDLIRKIKQEVKGAVCLLDIQGTVRHLKDPKTTTPADWKGIPVDIVNEWVNMPNAGRVIYEKPYNLDMILENVGILKLNEGELGILADVDLMKHEPGSEGFREKVVEGTSILVKRAQDKGNMDIVVTATLGSFGAYTNYRDFNGERVGDFVDAVTARRDEINPTGAGDTYSAAFLVAYRKRPEPLLATKYALAASSLGVEKDGPRDRPEKEDVFHRMIEYYGIR